MIGLARRDWLLSDQPASRAQARLGQAYRSWDALRANRLAMLGLAIVVALIAVAILADVDRAPTTRCAAEASGPSACCRPPGRIPWAPTTRRATSSAASSTARG